MEDIVIDSQIIFTGLSVFVGFIVACIYYFWYVKNPSRVEKFIENAKKKGNVVTATCVKTKFVPGSRESEGIYKYDTKIVTYEYTVNGKKYKKKFSFQSPGCVSIDFPYTLTFYYSEKNPRKVYTGVGNKYYKGYICALVVWFLFVFILVRIIVSF